MIIGTYYDGDNDNAVARKQHDVYADALGIIITTCNRLANFAKSLLGDTDQKTWGTIYRCDHRTLQFAHDLLAAAWRFRNALTQLNLPFEAADVSTDVGAHWLHWLREEISGWIDHPYLVRSVQIILTNQNKPAGYAAESHLCLGIMDRFPDVPWQQKKREAFEEDLLSDKVRVADVSSDSPRPPSVNMDFECTGRPPCTQLPCQTMSKRANEEGPRSGGRPPPMSRFIGQNDQSIRITRPLINQAFIRNRRKWPTP